MQRNRNIRLLILFVTLVLANVALFLFLRSDERSAVDPTLFKVDDLTKIDEVVLTRNGQALNLKFNGGIWTVNNQPADRRMIDVLFATLQQVQPKRPVAETIQDSVNNVLENEGVSVKLLSANELQKEFFVGGNVTKTQAYFKDKVSNKSYVVVIPGYRVYAGGIFELDETGWKDKYVFSFNWRNFQSLSFKVPANPKANFEINLNQAYYEVQGISSVDTTKLNDFLDAVSLLTVDHYIKNEDLPSFDNVRKSGPLFELLVMDVSGKGYSLALYEYGAVGQVLGYIQGSQLAVFDRKKLTAIAKSRNWFEKK
jgi:hypothetical protein